MARWAAAVGAIHPAFWVAGLVGLLALVVYRPNPLLIVILIVAALELRSRWMMRSRPMAGCSIAA